MHPLGVAAIVLGVTMMDLIIFMAIFRALAHTMNDLGKDFPAVEPEPGAVRRGFQSFKVGIMNLGLCIHAAADASHLHLDPAWVPRKMGMKPMSIPWERIELKKVRGSYAKAKIGRHVVVGPRWCLELADPTRARPAA